MVPGKIIVTTVLLFVAVTLASCTDNDRSLPLDSDFEAFARLSGLSDCLEGTTDLSSSNRTETLTAVVEQGTVLFSHAGARFNCCMDSVSLEIVNHGSVLRIVETPHTAEPCRCECGFLVQGEVLGLSSGNYRLEVASTTGADVEWCAVDIRVD